MACRQPCGAGGRLADTGPACSTDLVRSVRPAHDQRIRFHLRPFEAAGLAVDAQLQPVLLADGDLAGEQHTFRAARETQQHVAVVLQASARDERGEIGAQRLDLKTGHVLGQVFAVGADVAHAARRARAAGSVRHIGLLVAGRLLAARQPALDVLDHDPAHIAEGTGANKVPRLLHHRVARVVVGQSEDQVLFARQGGEFLRLGEIERGGLVRHHVETGLQGGPGDRMVGVVRRGDDDEVHAVVVGTTGFGCHHLIVGAVAALRVDAVAARHRPGGSSQGRWRTRRK